MMIFLSRILMGIVLCSSFQTFASGNLDLVEVEDGRIICQTLNGLEGKNFTNPQLHCLKRNEQTDGRVYRVSVTPEGGKEHIFAAKFLGKGNQSTVVSAYYAASEGGYGPKVYYSDLQRGFILMEFIEQDSALDRGSPEFRTQIAHILGKLHSSDLECSDERNKFNQIRNFEEWAHAQIALLPQEYKDGITVLKSFVKGVEGLFQRVFQSDLRLTHGDLNQGNIFCQGNRVLISDWGDTLSLDYYSMELSAFLTYRVFDEKGMRLFLRDYFGETPFNKESELNKILALRPVALLWEALGNLLAVVASGGVEDTLQTSDDFQTMLGKINSGKVDLDKNEVRIAFTKSIIQFALEDIGEGGEARKGWDALLSEFPKQGEAE